MIQRIRSSRVTLLLLGVSVAEIPAGTDCDLQTGGVGVVGQSQLQLPGRAGALEQAAVCADAAVAALGGKIWAVASQFMIKSAERLSGGLPVLLTGAQNVQSELGGCSDYNHVTGCHFFFSDYQLLLTLFPPEYSEPKDVSSSAPVEEPSWSLSLLLLNRFGRLGPLKSWRKEEDHLFAVPQQTDCYSVLSPAGTSKGLRLPEAPRSEVTAAHLEPEN